MAKAVSQDHGRTYSEPTKQVFVFHSTLFMYFCKNSFYCYTSLHSLSASLLSLIRWVKNYTEIFRHAVLIIYGPSQPQTLPHSCFPKCCLAGWKWQVFLFCFVFLTNELNSQKVGQKLYCLSPGEFSFCQWQSITLWSLPVFTLILGLHTALTPPLFVQYLI